MSSKDAASVPVPEAGSTHVLQGGYTIRAVADRVIGNGSFGVVFEAKIVETNETVAVKKVLQDKRFKNRELEVMAELRHPNVVLLKYWFFDTHNRVREDGSVEEDTYLNLVQEFVPDTVHKITRHYTKMRQLPPIICVKLYTYQMCRSLAYLHSRGVCHRDIKPQNLLVDSRTHVLKLCDFGSAKALVPGEPSVSYICSRYYRAPELIFGATEYTCAIDIWSAGCVAAELLLGRPLLPGDTGTDQLVEIIKVLGTPTREEVAAMNPTYTEFKFPQIRPYPWNKIFKPRAPAEAIDLIARLLCYVPTQRLSALEACAHPFFDELRDPRTRLPNDQPLPPLFDWSDDELASATPELRDILMPPFARPPNWSAGAPGTGTLRPPVMRAAAPAVATSPHEPDSPSGSRGVRDSGTSAEAMRAAAVAAVGAGAAATAAASGSYRLPAAAADKGAAASQKLGR